MFSAGSNGSFTCKVWAVAGISCINPMAPFGDTAHGRFPDSCSITACSSVSLNAFRFASRSTMLFNSNFGIGGQFAEAWSASTCSSGTTAPAGTVCRQKLG